MQALLGTPAGFGVPEVPTAAGLEGIFADIREAAARVQVEYGNLETLVRRAVLGGAAVGGLAGAAAVGYYLYRNLDTIREALNKILSEAETAIRNGTPVLSLIHHSYAWVTTVKTPASDLMYKVDDFVNYDFVSWSGPAAEVYKDKRARQKDAVGELVAKAEFISSWLFKIAKANVDYAVELAKVLTALVGALAAALVNAGSVINLLFSLDDLAELVGRFVEGYLNAVLLRVRLLVESLGDVRDLFSVVGDHSKLPGGKWPEAVRG
jgi:hypothetical protein